jgi:hypothetical protein
VWKYEEAPSAFKLNAVKINAIEDKIKKIILAVKLSPPSQVV